MSASAAGDEHPAAVGADGTAQALVVHGECPPPQPDRVRGKHGGSVGTALFAFGDAVGFPSA
ncbi:hypothetical protein ACFRMN_26290 [Streptomyces sp. NPDC056835]|uniref:hypothetical protein n=1 Tax=Streptomyces sp. NPDC056835 TaxID=3345956 RepID=UPI003682FDF5